MKAFLLTFLVVVAIHSLCDLFWWWVGRYTKVKPYRVILGIVLFSAAVAGVVRLIE